jgi:adenosine deaminase
VTQLNGGIYLRKQILSVKGTAALHQVELSFLHSKHMLWARSLECASAAGVLSQWQFASKRLRHKEIMMDERFIEALRENSIAKLQVLPKSDLHNHAGRGGNIQYIEAWANVKIKPPDTSFNTLAQMQAWFETNVKCHCSGRQGYLKRIEAAFAQAQKDHITVLAMSFGIGEIDFLGNMESFSQTVNALHQQYAPHSAFFPELALGRESAIDPILNRLDEIISYHWFKSVDICNNEFAQPIRNFQPIYKCG